MTTPLADAMRKPNTELYNAHILTIAETIAGLCDVRGLQHPEPVRIREVLLYMEFNSPVVVGDIQHLLLGAAGACTNTLELLEVCGLFMAGTSRGYTVETLWPDLVAALFEAKDATSADGETLFGDRRARDLAGAMKCHPDIVDDARKFTQELRAIWEAV